MPGDASPGDADSLGGCSLTKKLGKTYCTPTPGPKHWNPDLVLLVVDVSVNVLEAVEPDELDCSNTSAT